MVKRSPAANGPTTLVGMEILGTTLRVCVTDLESSVPFYERLTGSQALRFERGGVSVAAVGCFLLMSGPEEELEVLRRIAATIAVKDVGATAGVLDASGAKILVGPVGTPAGRNLIAMHPDGAVFEYVDQGAPA
ncbi:Glyoxalase-like domain [Streptomyces sp. AmelKG-E11A]|nr:Glyoxalase-like domain [Streptomyces sp. AmelKG-E11A]